LAEFPGTWRQASTAVLVLLLPQVFLDEVHERLLAAPDEFKGMLK